MLTWAAYSAYTCTVEFLLNHGANPNHHESDGDTPLTMGVFGDGDIVTTTLLLLNHGANVNSVGSIGDTPLFKAVTGADCNPRLSPIVVRILIDHGANVNYMNSTISGYSVYDMSVVNRDADKPYEQDIINILRSHGARCHMECPR